MVTKRFSAKTEDDLTSQIWDWLSQHPGWHILKQHAVEWLPLQMRSQRPYSLIEFSKAFAAAVAFERHA